MDELDESVVSDDDGATQAESGFGSTQSLLESFTKSVYYGQIFMHEAGY